MRRDMDNHYHLLIQTYERPLSHLMGWKGTWCLAPKLSLKQGKMVLGIGEVEMRKRVDTGWGENHGLNMPGPFTMSSSGGTW